MKKIIFTAAAVLAFGFSNAQDIKFGAKGGLDIISISGAGSATGFFIGGFTELNITDQIAIQPGINYHTASNEGTNFNYIGIPVLAKFNATEKLNLIAGPSLFYFLESTATEKTFFNIDFGASYDINENFFIEPRYSAGLTGEMKANHFTLGLGYKF